jgi:hypothetical protein
VQQNGRGAAFRFVHPYWRYGARIGVDSFARELEQGRLMCRALAMVCRSLAKRRDPR